MLKCFVLIDLKTGHLEHQDIGQMDVYVRMYDDLRQGEHPALRQIAVGQNEFSINIDAPGDAYVLCGGLVHEKTMTWEGWPTQAREE